MDPSTSYAVRAVRTVEAFNDWRRAQSSKGHLASAAAFLRTDAARAVGCRDKGDLSRRRFYVTHVRPHVPFLREHGRIGRREVYALARLLAAARRSNGESTSSPEASLAVALQHHDIELAQRYDGGGSPDAAPRMDTQRVDDLMRIVSTVG